MLENPWNRFSFSLKNTGAKEKREFIVYINSNATARTFYIHRSKKKITKHFNKVMYYAKSRGMLIFHQEKTKFSGLFKLELRK